MSRDRGPTDRHGEKPKVFGLGLSRTGTKSLTVALHLLGFDVIHYPTDQESLATMTRGDGRFPLLDRYDGLTDIVTIPFLVELDTLHPGARFILTVRTKEDWLRSMEKHWQEKPVMMPGSPVTSAVHVRCFLRAAVYGCYEFNRERLNHVYDDHLNRVRAYFSGRSGDLLEIDITDGEGWEKLAPFLGRVSPDSPFPYAPTQRALERLYPQARLH